MTTLWVYVNRPSHTSSNVGARPPSDASSSSILAFTSGFRETYSKDMVIVAACVWCPAAMMSFMSPQSSSSVYARFPWSSSRYSIVSRRHTCSISSPRSLRALCISRLCFTMSSPILSRESYASISSCNRPTPNFAPSFNSGSGVMKTWPMISADLWYASSIGFASNLPSPVMTVRDLSSRLKL